MVLPSIRHAVTSMEKIAAPGDVPLSTGLHDLVATACLATLQVVRTGHPDSQKAMKDELWQSGVVQT